jgi:hypothetical protein
MRAKENELYYINVPNQYKNFKIVTYNRAGTYIMETDSKQLNHWKEKLPKGYTYEIIGFVNDIQDKNFALKRTKLC